MFNTYYDLYTERLQDALTKARSTASYDECTIRSLRKDNEILNKKLREQLDTIRELRRDGRKAKRLKTALNDFLGPDVESHEERQARENATFCENYGGSNMVVKVTKPRYNRRTCEWTFR